MFNMIEKIEALLTKIEQLEASDPETLETARVKYLGKKGAIAALMDDFRNVPAEKKREVGMRVNELKTKATEKIQSLKEQFEAHGERDSGIDLSRTAYPVTLGTRHPISIVKEEIIDIFKRLGFSIAEGPEVEDDRSEEHTSELQSRPHLVCRLLLEKKKHKYKKIQNK